MSKTSLLISQILQYYLNIKNVLGSRCHLEELKGAIKKF
jgi:hypothetical protein